VDDEENEQHDQGDAGDGQTFSDRFAHDATPCRGAPAAAGRACIRRRVVTVCQRRRVVSDFATLETDSSAAAAPLRRMIFPVLFGTMAPGDAHGLAQPLARLSAALQSPHGRRTGRSFLNPPLADVRGEADEGQDGHRHRASTFDNTQRRQDRGAGRRAYRGNEHARGTDSPRRAVSPFRGAAVRGGADGGAAGMTTRDIPVFLSIDAVPEALGFDSGAMKGIRELLIRYVEGGHIAGAAALVARYGQIVQRLAVGWADLDTKKPLASDTLFRIFSLTKPITSVAALMLVEQGAVALDDPVSDYIPAFRDVRVFAGLQGGRIVTEPPRRSLTVRHLLTHTSGVAGTAMRSDEPLAAAYRNARIGDERLTLAEMCERLAEIPLLFHPGEQWRYGVSTDVLARVVEVASGMSFGRFLRERLFLPLGMHDTSYVVPPEKRDRLATLYTATAGGLRPLKHTNVTPATAAAAGAAPADARAASNAQVARGEL